MGAEMSFVIRLSDGRVVEPETGAWTHGEAEQYLAELRRQADADDGGDYLIDVFDFVVADYSRALADASIIPMPT